jgi:hypothetical protein
MEVKVMSPLEEKSAIYPYFEAVQSSTFSYGLFSSLF